MNGEGKSAHAALEAQDEAAQNGTSCPNPMNNQSNGFLNLLRIDVVVEELLQYLSVEELTTLSSISKDALIAVRKSKVFSEKVHFRISEESIRSRVLNNSFHSWNAVRFEITVLDNGVVDYFPDSSTILQSLGSVQSLVIGRRYGSSGITNSLYCKADDFALKLIESSKDTLEALKIELYPDEIERIQCPNLKRLCLLAGYMHFQRVKVLLQNLPPLEGLTIQSPTFPSEIMRGLQGRMSKLRKLNIQIDPDLGGVYFTAAPDAEWNVMAAGMTSLEDIRVSIMDNPDYYIESARWVEKLFRNIPPETVTKISIENYPGGEEEICFSRFTNLTELSLCYVRNFNDDSLKLIIKHCRKLKNLSMSHLYGLSDFGVSDVRSRSLQFASNEPGVSLTGLRDLAKLTIRYCGCNHKVGEYIIRFTNLTELRLEYLEFFDNTSLQVIIKACRKLKKLFLVGLGEVTDFGVSGVESSAKGEPPLHHALNQRGVSLSDLKDLTSLTIRNPLPYFHSHFHYRYHYRAITLATLLRVIQFKSLTLLDLFVAPPDFEQQTPRKFLLQILEQNPSLKKVDLHITSGTHRMVIEKDVPLEKEAKILYPRIQRLQIEYGTRRIPHHPDCPSSDDSDYDPYSIDRENWDGYVSWDWD